MNATKKILIVANCFATAALVAFTFLHFRARIGSLDAKIQEKERRIAELNQEMAIARERVKHLDVRNQILVERIGELDSFVTGPGRATDEAAKLPRSITDPNPPAKSFKGKIDAVDATDRTLARVTLGTDHGLKVNHTLSVYRVDPEREYVGMIRIIDTHHQVSVGRLVRAPGSAATLPREGDEVTSEHPK